jgi:hypothetical protein
MECGGPLFWVDTSALVDSYFHSPAAPLISAGHCPGLEDFLFLKWLGGGSDVFSGRK